MAANTENPPLSVRDIATRLNLTGACVRNWIVNGLEGDNGSRIKLKARRAAKLGQWMVEESDLEDFLTSNEVSKGSPDKDN